jgi:hypothetical protein
MPISDLPQHELRAMTPQQLADLALAADQERRRALKAGDYCSAARWDVESERLAQVSRA